MESTGLMSDGGEVGHGGENGCTISAIENWGGIWRLDFYTRMRNRFNYMEIVRNRKLEEEKLRETAWCDLFQARILPRVCQLRKEYGFNCDACRGLRLLNTSYSA